MVKSRPRSNRELPMPWCRCGWRRNESGKRDRDHSSGDQIARVCTTTTPRSTLAAVQTELFRHVVSEPPKSKSCGAAISDGRDHLNVTGYAMKSEQHDQKPPTSEAGLNFLGRRLGA